MTDLPIYLEDETEATILQRMLDSLPTDLDKNEGSYLWDPIAAAAVELALAAIWAQGVLQRGFATTTFDEYLDLRCEEHGLTRRAAVKAIGQALFVGTPTTIIPADTRIAVPADPNVDETEIEYVTLEEITLDGEGTGVSAIEAVETGINGNVAAGTITAIISTLSGVDSVTNPSPTYNGLDEETDESLLTRYLYRVQHPSSGGNVADYTNWALEVSGVGAVSVMPIEDGEAGTVNIYLLDGNSNPADTTLVDAVQAYIAPGFSESEEAEDMTLSGSGVSIDGTAVKMIYDVAGEGQITHEDLDDILDQPGIWQARVSAKVDSNAGTTGFLQIGVWNVSSGTWASTRPEGTESAEITYPASAFGSEYRDFLQDFYWNGTDELELRIIRHDDDTVTMVWVDTADYVSSFSSDVGTGKAPIGARVSVRTAEDIEIDVSATLTIASGYTPADVIANATTNIQNYLRSNAGEFGTSRLVRYVYIGQAILVTPGVEDYTDLLVNAGVDNITIDEKSVATLGEVTLTT